MTDTIAEPLAAPAEPQDTPQELPAAPEPAQAPPARSVTPVEVPIPPTPLGQIPDATFDDLLHKPRRQASFTVTLPDGQGSTRTVKITYLAISGDDYDALQAAHKPTTKQRADGMSFNQDTFAPALISAVSLRPKLSVEQATQLYKHPDWSVGETSQLYMQAVAVCSAGLDVPFTETA